MQTTPHSTQLRYTVYDSKAEVYSRPHYFTNRATALRSIIEACKDPTHEYGRFPADFTFFEIGTFCELTSNETTYPAKISLGTGLDLRKTSTADHQVVMPTEAPKNAAA